jgi:hypothetical protein
LSVLCGLYNAAAWLSRRETHLAVNTVLYTFLTIWEQQHVAHHLAEMRRPVHEPKPIVPIETPQAQPEPEPQAQPIAAAA